MADSLGLEAISDCTSTLCSSSVLYLKLFLGCELGGSLWASISLILGKAVWLGVVVQISSIYDLCQLRSSLSWSGYSRCSLCLGNFGLDIFDVSRAISSDGTLVLWSSDASGPDGALQFIDGCRCRGPTLP